MTAERVVLLRHGRTAHNHGGIWQGQTDTDLDDVGRAQAARAAAALVPLLDGAPDVRLVASDLRRAWDTAGELAALTGLERRADKRLREVDAGAWEGLSRPQIVAAGMGDMLAAWQRGEDVPVGGGERRSEVGVRGAAAVREHARAMTSGTLVVVAHGGLIRGTVLALLGLDPAQWNLLGGLGNCHWGVLAAGHGAWRLVAWNTAAPDPAG